MKKSKPSGASGKRFLGGVLVLLALSVPRTALGAGEQGMTPPVSAEGQETSEPAGAENAENEETAETAEKKETAENSEEQTKPVYANGMVNSHGVLDIPAEAGEAAVRTVEKAVYIADGSVSAGRALEVHAPVNTAKELRYQWTLDGQPLSGETGMFFIPKETYYEHWIGVSAYEDGVCLGSDQIYFSRLPVVYIDTEGGEEIVSKDKYLKGVMRIQGNEEYSLQYEGGIRIKGRGNSTWAAPKKPYKIKLDKSTDLFGFGKNKTYVLLANYLDESLMRNTLAAELSERLGLVSTETVWVDVVLNGTFAGNYQLCESVSVGKARVPVYSWEDAAEDIAEAVCEGGLFAAEEQDGLEDFLKENLAWASSGTFTYQGISCSVADYDPDFTGDITGGYLFESSIEYDEASKFTTPDGWMIMLKEPEFLCTNSEMMDYVRQLWEDYGQALKSEDGYNAGGIHYTQIADFDSMVGYWLTMEILANPDAVSKSRYAYQDRGGRLTFGPVWDFDWAIGSAPVASADPSAVGWKVTTETNPQNFYQEWVDDPYFMVKAAEKYQSVRAYLGQLVADGGILDGWRAYLAESGGANASMWTVSRGFEADVKALKEFLKERIAWLDRQFAGEDQALASVRGADSAHPYTRDVRLVLSAEELRADTEPDGDAETDETGAAAGAEMPETAEKTRQLLLTLRTDGFAAFGADVYVNGLKYGSVDVSAGTASLKIDFSALTEEPGTKNVISVIARDSSGETAATNFISVTAAD